MSKVTIGGQTFDNVAVDLRWVMDAAGGDRQLEIDLRFEHQHLIAKDRAEASRILKHVESLFLRDQPIDFLIEDEGVRVNAPRVYLDRIRSPWTRGGILGDYKRVTTLQIHPRLPYTIHLEAK